MKAIAKIFEEQRKHFEKGGKFELLYPLFEAKETFLFTTAHKTKTGSHIRDAIDTKRLMSTVIMALVPCLLFGIYNVGYQYHAAQGMPADVVTCMLMGLWKVLPILLVTYAVGGTWELVFALVRKHEINEGFLVTGMLVPLIVPPTIPLWQLAIGISFGVVIGKEVFGGTGMNIFNPALTARAFLFFAFPAQISGDKVWTFLGGTMFDAAAKVDGYSGATPLAVAASSELASKGATAVESLNNFGLAQGFADYGFWNMFIGLIPGSIGETSTLAILIGAAYLVFTGVGSLRIMASVVVGGLVMGWIFNMLVPHIPAELAEDLGSGRVAMMALPAHYHLVMGGFAFGTVFMATDPVSAAGTPTGKIIYGFLIGAIAVLIRAINPAYPEGMMLSILFFNMAAPLIDHYIIQSHMKRRLSRV